MSYCRFSSDDFACDLYCYADCHGGYTTHIAGLRIVGDIPKVPDILLVDSETWLAAHRAQMAFLETAERVRIDHPLAGCSFNDPDLISFRARIAALLSEGLRGTPFLLEAIDEEIREEAAITSAAALAPDPAA